VKELIDEPTFVKWLIYAAIFVPLFFGVDALVFGWKLKKPWLRTLGIVLTVGPPMMLLLWFIYARVVQHFGLDSVKGLGDNLAIFVIAGLIVGLVVGFLVRKWSSEGSA
jgi:hypothetical protein